MDLRSLIVVSMGCALIATPRVARATGEDGGVKAARASAVAAAVIVLRRSAARLPATTIATVEEAIAANAAFALLPRAAAAERLGSRIRRPSPGDPRATEALLREAGEILEAAAFGRDAEAIQSGRRVLAREAPRLDAMNRFPAAASALGDICWFVVRALLHRGDEAGAEDQARECARLVPGISPSPDRHPPDVIALLAAARGAGTGRLRITRDGHAGIPCSVRVQGISAGELPRELELVAGHYAVQAACRDEGAIHDVVVEAGGLTNLVVEPELEHDLELYPYITVTPNETLDDLELWSLSEWLGVREMWVLESAGRSIRIVRMQRTTRGGFARRHDAVAEDPASGFPERVRAAVRRLACEGAPCDGARPPSASSVSPWALATGGLGFGLMAGAWFVLLPYNSLDRSLDHLSYADASYGSTLEERNAWGNAALVLSGSGAAIFAGAAPFFLPPERGVPTWAVVIGLVGLGMAGSGAVLWAEGDTFERTACPSFETCLRRRSAVPFAPMLVMEGTALVSLPLTYLVRARTGSDFGAIGFGASPERIGVTWSTRLSTF